MRAAKACVEATPPSGDRVAGNEGKVSDGTAVEGNTR